MKYNSFRKQKLIIFIILYIFNININAQQINSDILNKIDSLGRKQGVWQEVLNKRNKKYTRTTYVNNKKEGKVIVYFEDGKIAGTGYYINDKAEGLFIKYFHSGIIEVIHGYSQGKKTGWEYIYYASGKIKDIRLYKSGKFVLGSYISFYENGNISIKTYMDNKIKGLMHKEIYYKNGVLKGIGQKLNGKNYDVFIYYDKSGNITKKEQY